MITVRVTREYTYLDGSEGSDTYELETDQPYNPTIVRDLRDTVMSMLPDVEDTEAADMTEYEEDSSE